DKYAVDYLVVRDCDFDPVKLRKGEVYFQPFGRLISDYVGSRRDFAVLDASTFPPIYQAEGVRVIKLR
ncbi:MAG: hypothetical protein V2B18_10870, partial [Pseudomonadota bacterium]